MENTASTLRLNSRTRQWLLTQLQLIEENYGNPLPKTPAQAEALVFNRATSQAEYVHLARCLLSKTLAMAQTGGRKGSGDLSQSPPADLQDVRISAGQFHGALPVRKSPFVFPTDTNSASFASSPISQKRPARSPSCPLFNDDKSLWQPYSSMGKSKRRGSQFPPLLSDRIQSHLPNSTEACLSTKINPESLLHRSTKYEEMAQPSKKDTVRVITRQNGFSYDQEATVKKHSTDIPHDETTADEVPVYEANFTLLVPIGTRIEEVVIHLAEKD